MVTSVPSKTENSHSISIISKSSRWKKNITHHHHVATATNYRTYSDGQLHPKSQGTMCCFCKNYTRVEKLFEAVLDGKIDNRTAKVIKIDDLYDSKSGGFDGSTAKKPLPRFNWDISESIYFFDKFIALIILNALLNET
jgi:hypothetical protein